jgi:hypothetical protein
VVREVFQLENNKIIGEGSLQKELKEERKMGKKDIQMCAVALILSGQ